MHGDGHGIELGDRVIGEADELDSPAQTKPLDLATDLPFVLLVTEHRRTDDAEGHLRMTAHDLRGGADELELTLGRADAPEEPDDRVGRSGARLGADLRRHEAGVGDGDLDPRQGRARGAGVGDDPLRAPRRHVAHEAHQRTRQVVGGDAVVHVPHQRPAGQAGRWHAEDVRLERRRVDDVDVELTQPSGQTSDEGGGPHRGARRRAQPRCLLTSGRADALVEGQHLDRMPALAQPTDQGAVGEQDDSRVDVVTLGEGVHEAHERQLDPAELCRVVEDRHAHRSVHLSPRSFSAVPGSVDRSGDSSGNCLHAPGGRSATILP